MCVFCVRPSFGSILWCWVLCEAFPSTSMVDEDERRITDENLSEGMTIGAETSRAPAVNSQRLYIAVTARLDRYMIAEVPGSRYKDSTAPSVPPRVTPPSAERLKQGVVQAPFSGSSHVAFLFSVICVPTNSIVRHNQTHAAPYTICHLCVPTRRCPVAPLGLR